MDLLSLFQRYPPPIPPVDPARPWWVAIQGGFRRMSDDAVVLRRMTRPFGWAVETPGFDTTLSATSLGDEHVTELVDRNWPAARPSLVVGQVWATETQEFTILTLGHSPDGEDVAVVVLPDDDGIPSLVPLPSEAFQEAVLVRGDRAPWAPPSKLTGANVPAEGGTP